MYDYHTHTAFSDDAEVPMENMIISAIKKGVKEIAVTDHFDPDYPDPEFPFLIDFYSYYRDLLMYEEAYAGKIDIIKGIEIGIQHGKTINKCKYIAGSFGYDFIIGSFHCFNGHDLYKYGYVREKTEKTVMEFYEYMLSCLEQFNNYDVLGHFNIIDRYLPYVPDYDQYMDVIAAILRLLIRNGKGIEINTSSFRYGMGERTTAAKEILLLYKDLYLDKFAPSEAPIITVGSDAHSSEYIAYKYFDTVEYMKSLGFEKLSLFKERELRQIKI